MTTGSPIDLDATKPTTEPSATNWSIADVERETGLGKDTLRVWERRYGFPDPQRDALGERRFDASQLARLRLIKRLLDQGHRPGRVVALPPEALQQLIADAASSTSAEGQALNDVNEWLAWLQNDQLEELRQATREHLQRHGLGPTIENFIAPLSVQVGEAWLAGRLSVYQEHLYTEMVQTLMREAMVALASPSRGSPRVILGTVPRERHAVGLLMAECFLAMEGCDCRPLGPGTPLQEFVAAAQRMQGDVVALSFSAHAPAQEVVADLRQLRALLPASVELWVGGGAQVLYSRRRPNGVVALRRAQDLGAQVAAWRKAHTLS